MQNTDDLVVYITVKDVFIQSEFILWNSGSIGGDCAPQGTFVNVWGVIVVFTNKVTYAIG